MKPKLMPMLIANLFAVGGAAAADEGLTYSGTVDLGGRYVNTTSVNAGKLNEYRDLKNNSGIVGGDFKGTDGSNYIKLFGENLGRTDQYIDFKAGRYGVYKIQAYDDELKHNYDFNARTPYSGIGGATLTGPTFFSSNPRGANNPDAWNTFDYGWKRQNKGGSFELGGNSPWFLRADVKTTNLNGVKPITTSGLFELPAPVNYSTTDFSAEGGWASKRGQFSVSALRSKFNNTNDNMQFTNPTIGTVASVATTAVGPAGGLGFDQFTLPSDNTLTKYGANGVLKQLPLNSTLAGRYSHSSLTNNFDVTPGTLIALGSPVTGTGQRGTASPGSFNGDITIRNTQLSLSSSLTKELDSRVYWTDYKKENNSNTISYMQSSATGVLTPYAPAYAYTNNFRKRDFGLDLGYRIDRANKLSGGFEYVNTDRTRDDFDNTKDKKVYVEWKNKGSDLLSARVKAQYMQRRSHNVASDDPTVHPDTDTALVEHVFARFDVANNNQGRIKLSLESTPRQFLDLGFDAIFKQNKYQEIQLGRTQDTRQQYTLTAGFGDANSFRVNAFADYERVQFDMNERYIPRSGAQNFNPDVSFFAAGATPISTYSYNWTSRNKDTNWSIGVGADWVQSEKMKFNGSFLYAKTTGLAEYASVNDIGTPANIPGSTSLNMDNTTKKSLNLRAIYTVDKHWTVNGGFAWERYSFASDQYAGYNYTAVTAANVGTAYLSGAGFAPDYSVRILYLTGSYKF
jgi:MtrB/PioB family decaheme-associated outer membrane protein